MRIQPTTEERERFEKFVDRSGGPHACHPWTGSRTPQEYGRFKTNGRNELAHRVAWVLAGNAITLDKPCVLHDCPGSDNPACCNPRHLWAGTVAENNRDKARKGRGVKSASGLPLGVVERPCGRFQVGVAFNGKRRCLGTYDTVEEASAVALAEKERLYG